MKNIVIILNIGILLAIIMMSIIPSTISIIGGADGITDILISNVFVFGMIYIFFVAIVNIVWLWKKYPKDTNV